MGRSESDSALQVVAEHGSKLGKLKRFSKDVLVKSFRQAATALSQVEQPSPEDARRTSAVGKLERAVAPLRVTIVKHSLWKHSDKDVTILVAICASEMFRLLAPEPPFEDRNIRDVFELFLRVFKELDDIDSTYFSKKVKILETISRCKCYLILLDIDCEDLILDMFETFFSVVREHHPQALHNDVLSIMTNILCEDVPHVLVEIILRQLINDNEGAISAPLRLAISVIQSCQDKIRPVVCGLLASCSFNKDTEGSDLKASYHEIAFKIFQHAPEMIQDFIPTLSQELLTDQVDVRIKVVRLIGKLFSLSGYHVAQSQHDLFMDFLKRFSDKSVEVRIAALQCAKDCCLVNLLGKESQELMSALESRLWDLDGKVRMQAVTVACDLATSNLKFVSPRLVSVVTERLRDKKISVRNKAFQKLMEVYRHYCSECAKGHMTIFDDFEDIACKILMLCYDKDSTNFKPPNMEIVIAEELFPISLSVEERVLHWIHLYSLFGPLHRKAFSSILTQKRRLQAEMQHYLSLRKQVKERSSDDMQKQIKSSFVKMSTSFPDPSSAEEFFNKLNQMKDHNIFTVLKLLLDEVSIVSAQAIKDRFMKIVGDKHPQVEFLRLLSSKCSPNIFDSEHVHFILNYIRKSGSVDTNLVAASFDLLLVITSNFPSLLKGSELQLKVLMEEHLTNDKLIQVLATAGSKISVNFSEFYPCLKKLCLDGTRAQAKCAVSAISSLLSGSDQLVLAELCEELADSLLRGENVSTVLQSLGCTAQCSVLAYKAQEARVESYIYENILQAGLLDDPSLEDSYCASAWKFKIYGLKTIIMSFSPHGGPDVKQKIDKLLGLLLQMLQKCEINSSTISSDDTADMRLAASKSILQLSRRYDLHVPPDVFRLTVLTAMDPSYFVRRLFLEKVHKLLKERAVPRRYACAFALATTDPLKDIQYSAYHYMEGFILKYSNEAKHRQHSSVHGASFITEHPAYVVLFLIHILAHDANFPPDACQDEGIYARFFWPLLSFLWALLDVTIVGNDLVHSAAFCLHYMFRAITKAEDAVAAKQTPRLHFLSEVGNSVLRLLQPNGISATQSPGQILLPSSFYRLKTSKRSSEENSNGVDQTLIDKIVHRFQSLSVNRIQHYQESCPVDGASNAVAVKHDFSSVLGKNGPVSSNSLGNVNSKRHASKKRKNGAYANSEAASSKGQYLFRKSVNTSFSQERLSFEKVEQSLGSWKEKAVASEVFAAEPSNDLERCTKKPSGAKIKCDSREVKSSRSKDSSLETVSHSCLTEREVILADKSNTLILQPLADTCAARVKKGQRLSVEASSVSEICDLTREVSRTRRRRKV